MSNLWPELLHDWDIRLSQSTNLAAHRLYLNRQSQTLKARQHGLIDIAGLAERLGVYERFVRRLIAERRVPFFKVGK